jgi:phosphoglycerate kinase
MTFIKRLSIYIDRKQTDSSSKITYDNIVTKINGIFEKMLDKYDNNVIESLLVIMNKCKKIGNIFNNDIEPILYKCDNNIHDYIYMLNKDNNEIVKLYRQLGNVYISDAFGCLHRNHMSICDMKYTNKIFGYGYLIKKELDIFEILVNNPDNKKILGIIGGNKISDKLPLILSLRNIKNTELFISGGLALQYNEEYDNVEVMHDGYGNKHIYNEPVYIESKYECLSCRYNFYDIGKDSYENLLDMINNSDIVFWNGSLGVIEHDIYKKGSVNLANYLINSNKKIIIGGGETASLFEKDRNDNVEISTGGGALLEYLHNKIINKTNLVGLQIFC